MNDYRELVADYERRLNERKAYCSLNRVSPQYLSERYVSPHALVSTNLLYLGFGRNAWHSTWIDRYYPGSVSMFKSDLVEIAEKRRVQGSQFKIMARPSIFIRFASKAFAIMPVNDKDSSAYESLLQKIEPWNLRSFWLDRSFKAPDWLLVFSISGWRPDLFPQNQSSFHATPQGAGRSLKWNVIEDEHAFSGFRRFRDKFPRRLLNLQNSPTV